MRLEEGRSGLSIAAISPYYSAPLLTLGQIASEGLERRSALSDTRHFYLSISLLRAQPNRVLILRRKMYQSLRPIFDND